MPFANREGVMQATAIGPASGREGQCRSGCEGIRRLGPTGYCRVCFEVTPRGAPAGDPLQEDLRIVFAGIERVQKALIRIKADERRVSRIRRSAGAPTARAVAGYDLAGLAQRRQDLEEVLCRLQRERDGLALEILARDRELEAARDQADREMDARFAGVEP